MGISACSHIGVLLGHMTTSNKECDMILSDLLFYRRPFHTPVRMMERMRDIIYHLTFSCFWCMLLRVVLSVTEKTAESCLHSGHIPLATHTKGLPLHK